MWHQMGKVALQIDDFHLASQAYQEVCFDCKICVFISEQFYSLK